MARGEPGRGVGSTLLFVPPRVQPGVTRISLAVALAAILLALPSSASAARRDCWPRGTQTLQHSDHARVWKVDLGDEVRTYGCLYSTGRRVALDQALGGEPHKDSEPPYRLAGRYVAHVAAYLPRESYQGIEYGVDVIDLRTGRVVRDARDAWNDGEEYDPEYPPSPGFRSFVLTKGGLAAWITTYYDESQVWRLDSRGARRLDRAPRRALGALRVASGRVEWTNAGVRRRASFR